MVHYYATKRVTLDKEGLRRMNILIIFGSKDDRDTMVDFWKKTSPYGADKIDSVSAGDLYLMGNNDGDRKWSADRLVQSYITRMRSGRNYFVDYRTVTGQRLIQQAKHKMGIK